MLNSSFSEEYYRALNLLESGNFAEGVLVLEASASKGDAEAATYLGYLCLTGLPNGTANPTAAKQWFLKGSELGSMESEFQFGLIEIDLGAPDAAFSWFEKAANQGHIAAAQRMGYLDLHDKNLSSDKALIGFEKMKWAAIQGHAFAMRDLSKALMTGVLGQRALYQAFHLRFKSLVTLIRLAWRDQNHPLIR